MQVYFGNDVVRTARHQQGLIRLVGESRKLGEYGCYGQVFDVPITKINRLRRGEEIEIDFSDWTGSSYVGNCGIEYSKYYPAGPQPWELVIVHHDENHVRNFATHYSKAQCLQVINDLVIYDVESYWRKGGDSMYTDADGVF